MRRLEFRWRRACSSSSLKLAQLRGGRRKSQRRPYAPSNHGGHLSFMDGVSDDTHHRRGQAHVGKAIGMLGCMSSSTGRSGRDCSGAERPGVC